MPSIHWKLFTGLFISLFCFNTSINACAWDPAWDAGFYRFLEPEMSGLDEYRPFYFDWDLLYDDSRANPVSRRGANLQEWDNYFMGEFNGEALSEVIYTYKPEEIELALAGKKVSPVCAGNPLMAAMVDGGFKEFGNYLVLAKACETYNYSNNYWEELEPLPSSDDPLVKQLKEGYQSSTQASLKWRYAFQIVRLLHYGGFWSEAVNEYKTLTGPLAKKDNPLMYYWTLSQYAGVLHGLEERAKSAYYFSIIFDQCPSLMTPAWYSFDIKSDSEWNQVEEMCQSNDEIANLYFMRAIVPEAVTAEEIKAIQKFAPGSKKLDLLLLREINKLEELVLGYPYGGGAWWNEEAGKSPSSKTLERIKSLKSLVNETRKKGQMANQNLWDVSGAYLQYLGGDASGAREALSNLPQKGIDGARVRLLDLSIKIGSLNSINAKVENDVLKDFYNLKDLLPEEQVEELALFRDEKFSKLYKAQGQPGKAILAVNNATEIIYDPQLETINALMAFRKKAGKTLYEKELLGRLDNAYSQNDLLEMKATKLFSKNMLDEAIKIYEALPGKYKEDNRFFTIGPDPFASNMRDIINCEPGCIDNKYTKLSLAKTLLGLQKKAIEEPAKSGQYYHLLGNAYFNLSYYGACWKGLSYYRGYYWRGGSDGDENKVDLQLAMAMRFYEKSMKTSRNPEIAALSCMMAAKCEVVENFSVIPDGFGYYDQMMSNYSGTDVYDKAMRECKYFSFYTQR